MKAHVRSLKKILLIAIGGLCLALGIIGIILPLLPTTPFLLLAAACFAQSSETFHTWLINHAQFGSVIVNWQKHRSMTPKVKRITTVFILMSFSISIYWVDFMLLKVLLVLFLIGLLAFIWRLADGPLEPR